MLIYQKMRLDRRRFPPAWLTNQLRKDDRMVKDQIISKVKELKLTEKVREIRSQLRKWKAYLPSTKTKDTTDPQ